MARSSARKGQTEPVAALAAVVIVAAALSLYVGAFEATRPGSPERSPAEQAADRIERALTRGGIVDPGRLDRALAMRPEGYHCNVTLRYGTETGHAGPAAPETADRASRRVSIRTTGGSITPGRVEVAVWS